MCRFVLLALLICTVATAETVSDYRPRFNKAAYKNTLWTQANPWFPPNMSRIYRAGGPDYAMKRYPADNVQMWKEVALLCKTYGLDGIQQEVIICDAPDITTLREMLEGFKQAGNGFKLGFMLNPFFGSAAHFAKFCDNMQDELASHPNVYRLDGHPVMTLYLANSVNTRPPAEWLEWFRPVEKKHGQMIFLADVAFAAPGTVEKLLPYVDGITMYGNWTVEMQRNLFSHVVPAIKKYPHKIFEASVHGIYLSHFGGNGVRPRLLDKLLASWDMTIAAQPDSIVLTNFFDIYENSRILPSYELEDVMLKIARDRMALFTSQPAPRDDWPDFRIVNFTSVMVGKDAAFDVIGFPVHLVNKDFELTLELLAPNGNTIYTFPKFQMNLNEFAIKRLNLSTLPFLDQLALIPRITYKQLDGPSKGSLTGMPTNLVCSMVPHRLFWSRSCKNILGMKSVGKWSLNSTEIGGVSSYPENGTGVIISETTQDSPWVFSAFNTAAEHVRIMRNGLELTSFYRRDLNFSMPISLPNPGAGIDSYHLELENRNGARFATLPVYVDGGKRSGTVPVPVITSDDKIKTVEIGAARIPYFYYPCNKFTGNILHDISGYDHHGNINARFDGGKLDTTGYHYEHTGIAGAGNSTGDPAFELDEDGSGFYRFKGAGFAALMGGTAFPYASTWELEMRVSEYHEQAILSTIQRQLNIAMSEDGHILVSRGNPGTEVQLNSNAASTKEVLLKSLAPLPLNSWNKITVVYDLKKLYFYLNGELQASASIAPTRVHEDLNSVYIGGKATFAVGCEAPYYRGDLRNLRLYGRNLSPDEWL